MTDMRYYFCILSVNNKAGLFIQDSQTNYRHNRARLMNANFRDKTEKTLFEAFLNSV